MLKKLLLILFLLFSLAVGIVFYLWNRAAELPDWYDEAASSTAEPATIPTPSTAEPAEANGATAPSPGPSQAPKQALTPRSAARQLRQDRQLRLDEPQLNSLMQQALDSRRDGRRIRQATKALRAELDGNRLVVGGVTDVDRLLATAENDRERAAIRKLTRLVPWIRGQDFYFGVRGRPKARNGQLELDDLTVQVGQLSFAPEDLADRFGLADELAEQDLSVGLPDLRLADVRVENDTLLLSVAE
ncbi:MAG: hypothetical protein AAF657_35405 [Acidobacteriota bacterium]